MARRHPTSTLDELLADPLIQAVMRADRVDPVVLRQELERARPRRLDLAGARVRFGCEPRAAFPEAGPPVIPTGWEAYLCG